MFLFSIEKKLCNRKFPQNAANCLPSFPPFLLAKETYFFFLFFELSGEKHMIRKGSLSPRPMGWSHDRCKLSLEIPFSFASNWPEQSLLSHYGEVIHFRPARHTGKSPGELLERFSQMKTDLTGKKFAIKGITGQSVNLNIHCVLDNRTVSR